MKNGAAQIGLFIETSARFYSAGSPTTFTERTFHAHP